MADVSITGALFAVMHKGRRNYKRWAPIFKLQSIMMVLSIESRDGRKSLVDMVTLYLVNTGMFMNSHDVSGLFSTWWLQAPWSCTTLSGCVYNMLTIGMGTESSTS